MEHKTTWLYPTLGSILIGSIFPILASHTLKSAPAFLTLTVTFSVAVIILWIIILLQRKIYELKNKEVWRYGLLTGIFNGLLFYGFYYAWLLSTTPGNAALIAQTEVIFSFLYFQAWHKESLSRSHIWGAVILLCWAIYILIPKSTGWNYWDLLIMIGMMFAPVGNFYQKKWRTHASSYTFLFTRYICTIPFVLWASLLSREVYTPITWWVFLQMALMGTVVFVIKNILWVEAIKTITVTRILALHGCMPFLTFLIIWVFQWLPPTISQLVSWIPILAWVILLSRK